MGTGRPDAGRHTKHERLTLDSLMARGYSESGRAFRAAAGSAAHGPSDPKVSDGAVINRCTV